MSNPFVTVYAEATPNPDALKFVTNRPVLENGTLEYIRAADLNGAPIAQKIFEFSDINRVFMAQNFITITKSADAKWVELIPKLRKLIKEEMEAGNELISDVEKERAFTPVSDDTLAEGAVERIKQILALQIQPAVEMDGGAIEFLDFNDGIVRLRLKGSCSGCPSSALTLKSGIENLLKRVVPEVKEVIAEDEVTV